MTIDYAALAPMLVTVGAAIVVLLGDLFLPIGKRIALLWFTVIACLGALAAVLLLAGEHRATFCLPSGSCGYVVDSLTVYIAVLLTGATAVVALMSIGIKDVPIGEYALLLLVSLTGGLALAGGRDLLTLVVGLETLSLPIYVLVGLRRTSTKSAEGALTFFLVSVSSTILTLLGTALIYGVTGSISLERIAAVLRTNSEIRDLPLTAAAIVLILVGFGFKAAVAPFHWWVADVYSGAPMPVAAYLSTVSKIGGIAGVLIVVREGFAEFTHLLGTFLAVLAVASMIAGNFAALRQRDGVRLLAWSSVAQVGYVVAPLAIVANRPEDLNRAIGASLSYLALYTALSLGAFSCLAALSQGSTAFAQLRGTGRRAKGLALAFALSLVGLAGLPPAIAGLVGKVVVLRIAMIGDTGWLAVAVAIATVVGLAYYLRLAGLLFAGPDGDRLVISRIQVVTVVLTTALVIVLGFAPQLAVGHVP